MQQFFLGTIGYIKSNLMSSSQASDKIDNDNFYPGSPNIPETEPLYPEGVPPVTSGLKYCFDSQNNTGNGWNSEVTRWTDLISGISYSLNANRYFEDTERFGRHTRLDSENWRDSLSISNCTLEQNFTVELCVMLESNNSPLKISVVNCPTPEVTSKTVGFGVGQYIHYKNADKVGFSDIKHPFSGILKDELTTLHVISKMENRLLTVSCYKNGVFTQSSQYQFSETDKLPTVTGTLHINRNSGTGFNCMEGALYAVRIYNRPLAEAEIAKNIEFNISRYSI